MKLRDSVVVLTRASTPQGRAAALRLARKGARLVLVARDGDALAELAGACERAGAPHAIAAPAELVDTAAVARIVAQTIDAFGRIDLWIDDAGGREPRRWWRRLAVAAGALLLAFGVRRLRALHA